MTRLRAQAEKKTGKAGGGADLAQVISLLLGLKKLRLCTEGDAGEEAEEGTRAAQERDQAYVAEVAALMSAHPALFPSFPFNGKALRERLERKKSLDRIVELLGALIRSARAARRSELAQAVDMADLAVETLANAQAHADTDEAVRESIGRLAAGPLAAWQARAQARIGPADGLPEATQGGERPGPGPGGAGQEKARQAPQDLALAALREALLGGTEEMEGTEGKGEGGKRASRGSRGPRQ